MVKLLQPGSFTDPLTEVLRNGARALLAQAIEAEVAEFLAKHADLKTASGLSRVVRHGHLPEREVMTGIGPVGVRQPRVRDRGAADDAGRVRFTPAILPPYARRSRSLEVLIPILYLKGLSTGDFEEALAALLGKDAPGLSASTIARLKEVWLDEHEHWRKRDLSAKRYVYVWADGIYLQARLEDAKQCILVIIGATPEGRKELLGFTDGARESAQDWRELLLDLKSRGLLIAPELAVADGALGFWKALGELWPTTREQRCWVHKTANVLNKLPRLLSASGVTEARDGGFGYDDGSRRSAVAGEHEGFLSSWPQWTQSTSHPCSTTRSASPWCASTAGQRASVALDAAATRWSGTGMTTHSRIGSGIAARRARRALTTSAGQCWPGTTSRCGSGCCASTSWV